MSQLTVPDIIKRNPFRILGCLSSSTVRERLSNKNKLNAYARINKECSFPLDFTNLFGSVNRAAIDIDKAEQSLDLPEDLIRWALFYFCKATPLDDIAINQILAGNILKAKEIWNKRSSFSSNINLSVLAICQKDIQTSVNLISTFIHNDKERNAFLSMLGLNSSQYTELDLIKIFVQALSGFTSWPEIYYAINNTNQDADIDYVQNETINPSIKRIENEILLYDKNYTITSGDLLLNKTREDLALIDFISRKHQQKVNT